jgi:hypothetical protein
VSLLLVWLAPQAWLAAGNLPGGLEALDRQSLEQAVATYVVLQEAGSKGLEYLEQVTVGVRGLTAPVWMIGVVLSVSATEGRGCRSCFMIGGSVFLFLS